MQVEMQVQTPLLLVESGMELQTLKVSVFPTKFPCPSGFLKE